MSEPKITISLTPEQARDVENALVIRAIQLIQRGYTKKARELSALSNKVYDLRKQGEGEAPDRRPKGMAGAGMGTGAKATILSRGTGGGDDTLRPDMDNFEMKGM